MKRPYSAATVGLALVGVLGGCSLGSQARAVELVASEMKFEPTVIEAKPGERITFKVVNKGTVMHEFLSDDIQFKEVEVEAGETKSVTVKMPSKAGEYTFQCEAKGHKEAGMTGKIIVK